MTRRCSVPRPRRSARLPTVRVSGLRPATLFKSVRAYLPLAAALALFGFIASLLVLRDLDLSVYWHAAQRVFVDGVEPYTRPNATGLPFTYPPTAFLLLWPLAGHGLAQAGAWLWTLNLVLAPVLMVLLPWDLARTVNAPAATVAGRRLRVWGPLYIACFGGLYLTLHFQQINLLLLLCLWGFWRVLRRAGPAPPTGSPRAVLSRLGAGAALALGSVAKPHYGLLGLGALGCLRRGRRPGPGLWLLLGAALGGAALLWLSLALAPAGSWTAWMQQILGTTGFTALPPGHSSIAAPWNRSIAGEVARWLVPNKFSQVVAASPTAAAWISAALVMALALATGWAVLRSLRLRARRCAEGDGSAGPVAVDLELSVLSVWVFLAAPASWTHHLVMLLPAALVLLRDAVLDPRARNATRLAAVLVLAVLALTLDDLIPREVRTSSQAIMALMTVAVVGLWALLLERLLAEQRASRAAARQVPARADAGARRPRR